MESLVVERGLLAVEYGFGDRYGSEVEGSGAADDDNDKSGRESVIKRG